MNEVKRVVMWKPARAEKRKPSGEIVPGEFIGKFRAKVPEGTPGAVRQVGKNEAGISWDYWAQEVDSIAGVVRWIDVRTSDYGPTIALFLESPKALHQITVPYDVRNIHAIMNHLCGLGKELEVAFVNVSYWVRKATDVNGRLKLDKKDNPVWQKDLTFRDVPKKFSTDEWKRFSAENDLDWFQENRAGKTVWNFEKELAFWLSKVVAVQRFLLGTEKCLPFCWNSITACEAPSPGGNLTREEIATCNSIYEAIRPLYRFPFSREESSADDVEFAPVAGYVSQPAAHAQPVDDFPVKDLTDYEDSQPGNVDDLPF
jgi:hypothetical protein